MLSFTCLFLYCEAIRVSLSHLSPLFSSTNLSMYSNGKSLCFPKGREVLDKFFSPGLELSLKTILGFKLTVTKDTKVGKIDDHDCFFFK